MSSTDREIDQRMEGMTLIWSGDPDGDGTTFLWYIPEEDVYYVHDDTGSNPFNCNHSVLRLDRRQGVMAEKMPLVYLIANNDSDGVPVHEDLYDAWLKHLSPIAHDTIQNLKIRIADLEKGIFS